MGTSTLSVCYMAAFVAFILGLRRLSDPASAHRGNGIAAAGMIVAILGTLFLRHVGHMGLIIGALCIGGLTGVFAARKITITATAQMVSLFNATGGACAALISILEFHTLTTPPGPHFVEAIPHHLSPLSHLMAVFSSIRLKMIYVLAGLIIGAVSSAGSIVAWARLDGRIRGLAFKGQQIVNLLLLIIIVAAAIFLYHSITSSFNATSENVLDLIYGHSSPLNTKVFYSIFILAILYGAALVLPIGSTHLPAVISLLVSLAGVAAACDGSLYDNKAMLTGGVLAGAVGALLAIRLYKAKKTILLHE